MSAHFLLWTRKSRVFSRLLTILGLLLIGIVFVSISLTPHALAQTPSPSAVITFDTSINPKAPSEASLSAITTAAKPPIVYSLVVKSTTNNLIKATFTIKNNSEVDYPQLYYSVYLRAPFIADKAMINQILTANFNTPPLNTSGPLIYYKVPQVFQLAQGETKDIAIEIPYSSGIKAGTYSLEAYISPNDITGLGGTSREIELEGTNQNLTYDPSSCKVLVNKKIFSPVVAPAVNPGEAAQGSCIFTNPSAEKITVRPVFNYGTRDATSYINGEKFQSKPGNPITFEPRETKTITLDLPVVQTPQMYDAQLSLINSDGQQQSAFVSFHWTVRGPAATILRADLNQQSYSAGEKAIINILAAASPDLYWGSTGPQAGSVLNKAKLTITIKSGTTVCATEIKDLPKRNSIDPWKLTFDTTIQTSCPVPQITATISQNGETLGTFSRLIGSQKAESQPNYLVIGLGAAAFLLLFTAILFFLVKKKFAKQTPAHLKILLILLITLGLFSLLGASSLLTKAEANLINPTGPLVSSSSSGVPMYLYFWQGGSTYRHTGQGQIFVEMNYQVANIPCANNSVRLYADFYVNGQLVKSGNPFQPTPPTGITYTPDWSYNNGGGEQPIGYGDSGHTSLADRGNGTFTSRFYLNHLPSNTTSVKMVVYAAGFHGREASDGGNEWSWADDQGSVTLLQPTGFVDTVNNNTCTISGWAGVPGYGSSINTDIYIGGDAGSGSPGFRVSANQSRTDVATNQSEMSTSWGTTQNVGFSLTLPDSFKDGVSRSIYAYAIDPHGLINPNLGNLVGNVQCTTLPTPTLAPTSTPMPTPATRSCTTNWVQSPAANIGTNQPITIEAGVASSNNVATTSYTALYMDNDYANPIFPNSCSGSTCTWNINAGSSAGAAHKVEMAVADNVAYPAVQAAYGNSRTICTTPKSWTTMAPSCTVTWRRNALTPLPVWWLSGYSWGVEATLTGSSYTYTNSYTSLYKDGVRVPGGSCSGNTCSWAVPAGTDGPHNLQYAVSDDSAYGGLPAGTRTFCTPNASYTTYTPGTPGAPQVQAVCAGTRSTNYITWNAVPYAAEYWLYRSQDGGPTVFLAATRALSFTDTSSGSRAYSLIVKDSRGYTSPESAISNTVTPANCTNHCDISWSTQPPASLINDQPLTVAETHDLSMSASPGGWGYTTLYRNSIQDWWDSCANNAFGTKETCTKTFAANSLPAALGGTTYSFVKRIYDYNAYGNPGGFTNNQNTLYCSPTSTGVTIYPKLVVSCSGSPSNPAIGQTVTWTATKGGGTGSYSESWSGNASSYSTSGSKTATVTVTSGSQTQSATCSVSVTPDCNAGVSCGACSVQCGSGGTQSCTTTTYNGSSSCTQKTTIQTCSPAPTCGVGSACVSNVCIATYSILGTVYNDYNDNAVFDKTSGDTGYSGGAVNLTNSSGQPATDVNGQPASVRSSGADGSYNFSNLAAGNYTVSFTTPPGYIGTTPSSRTVSIGPFGTTVNFGIIPVCSTGISCGACSVSCGSGTQTCTYTTSPLGACRRPANFSQSCNPTPPACPGVSCTVPGSADTGQNVTFTANATGGSGTYTYTWSGAVTDTTTSSSNTNSVNKIFTTTGSKQATITVSSAGTATNTCSIQINPEQPTSPIIPPPPTTYTSPRVGGGTIACTPAGGYTGNDYTLSWTNNDVPVTWVNISTYSDFTTVSRPYYNKSVSGGAESVTAPTGFTLSGGSTALVLQPATTYYVTVWNGKHSNVASFKTPDQCLTASCSGAPVNSAYTGDTITWTGTATGGNGTYQYTWSNAVSASTITTSPTYTVNTTYPTSGQKQADLSIVSGSQTQPASCQVTINAYATITGTVFEDSENPIPSGSMEAGDPGVAGATVILRNSTNSTEIARVTTTGSNRNNYTFANVRAGSYYVVQSPPAGTYSTTTAAVPVTIAAAQTQTLNFGIRTTSITARVVVDMNGNSAEDTGEPVYANNAITLWRMPQSTVYATQNTNASGTTTFSSLPFGDYQVNATLPAGYAYVRGSSGTFTLNQASPNPRYDLFIRPLPPTITGFNVNNASTTTPANFPGIYPVAGLQSTDGGANWINPARVSLNYTINATPSNSLQQLYLGIYDQSKGLQSSLTGIQSVIDAGPANVGLLIRYNAASQTFTVRSGGNWLIARNVGNIFSINNSSGKLLYTVRLLRVTPQVEFVIEFSPDFQSKNMYTAGYVVDRTGASQADFDADMTPSP